ncbi:hypothetical protein FGL68_18095, partial [Acinetobacter baumannii]|nr:hypothetical protein [Acinetobacter baumannii]
MKSILLRSALTIALMSSANLVHAELVTTSQIKKISGIDQQYIDSSISEKNDFYAHVNGGEFKHEVRQFEKSYDNQQAEQI